MKKQMIALLLCLGLLAALTACGGTDNSAASQTPEPSAEAFGNTLEGAAVTGEVTEAPESAEASQTEDAAEPQAELTEQAVIAVILCDASDGLTYSPSDPVYFWRAVGYLIGQTGVREGLTAERDGYLYVTEEQVNLFASALFAGETEIPSVTEEDPLVSWAEDGGYLIHAPELGQLTLSMDTPGGAGEQTLRAELIDEGTSLGSYDITLTAYTGDAAGSAAFPYSICAVTWLAG